MGYPRIGEARERLTSVDIPFGRKCIWDVQWYNIPCGHFEHGGLARNVNRKYSVSPHFNYEPQQNEAPRLKKPTWKSFWRRSSRGNGRSTGVDERRWLFFFFKQNFPSKKALEKLEVRFRNLWKLRYIIVT